MAINRLKDSLIWLKVATTLEKPSLPTHKIWQEPITYEIQELVLYIHSIYVRGDI